MQILHQFSSFCTSREDLKTIYILFVRSILEQSAVVWHSSLTKENSQDIEWVQKSAVQLIVNQSLSYKKCLLLLESEPLYLRRQKLCLDFNLKCLKDKETKKMFPLKKKQHNMVTKKSEIIEITKYKHERLKKSSIPFMRSLLN